MISVTTTSLVPVGPAVRQLYFEMAAHFYCNPLALGYYFKLLGYSAIEATIDVQV